jgi:hypothetical protein
LLPLTPACSDRERDQDERGHCEEPYGSRNALVLPIEQHKEDGTRSNENETSGGGEP